MKKKRKCNIDWKISDEKICWAATIMVVALLIVILCSCKTHKENTVDYQINSVEDYQEHQFEGQSDQVGLLVSSQRDTLKETVHLSGQIDIERDTAGRTIRIIYDHIFNGLQTSGSSKRDTVVQKQVIILTDSVGNGQTDTDIKGKTKEKTDAGFGLFALVGFRLLVCLGAILLFILIKKIIAWKGNG